MSRLEECPNCKHDLGIAITRYFWSQIVGTSDTSYFEYECPNCHTLMGVDVKTEPVFTISKLEENK
jgi:phage FluMu protein Com